MVAGWKGKQSSGSAHSLKYYFFINEVSLILLSPGTDKIIHVGLIKTDVGEWVDGQIVTRFIKMAKLLGKIKCEVNRPEVRLLLANFSFIAGWNRKYYQGYKTKNLQTISLGQGQVHSLFIVNHKSLHCFDAYYAELDTNQCSVELSYLFLCDHDQNFWS